jgi:hypothetical protein
MTTLIVVRRGASATFQQLQAMVAQRLDGDVELIWDRRLGDRRRHAPSVSVERRVRDRRSAEPESLDDPDEARRVERRQQTQLRMPERRAAERRRRAPDTWQTLGFVLVTRDGPAYGAAPGEPSG